jgi:hypothetical protein
MITEKQKYNIDQLSLKDHFEIIEVIMDRRGLVQYHEYKKISGYKKSRQSFYNDLNSGKIQGRFIFGNWFAAINVD